MFYSRVYSCGPENIASIYEITQCYRLFIHEPDFGGIFNHSDTLTYIVYAYIHIQASTVYAPAIYAPCNVKAFACSVAYYINDTVVDIIAVK